MSSKREQEKIGQVSIRKPSAFDLGRIINAQKDHQDRLIKCIHKDIYGRDMTETVSPQNNDHVRSILLQLQRLDPSTETVEKIIVYRSSSRR